MCCLCAAYVLLTCWLCAAYVLLMCCLCVAYVLLMCCLFVVYVLCAVLRLESMRNVTKLVFKVFLLVVCIDTYG